MTGAFKSPDDFEAGDFRRNSPRFQGENFDRNLKLVEKVKDLADAVGLTSSQLALAWVLSQGNDIVPIPGTKRRKYLEENARAVDVELPQDLVETLQKEFPPDVAAGSRYAPQMMQMLNR